MNKPFVSIGLPFYNDSKYLSETITSIINQTYKNWELIVVDDGSSDGSVDIVKSFSDSRIILISDGYNKGLPVRLNQIATLARGQYLARMDADDIMHPERIEEQVNYFINNPDIDVLGTSAYIINGDNNVIGKSILAISNPTDVSDIFKGGSFIHPSIMGKRSWFINNPYDESMRRLQDLELWTRTVSYSRLQKIDKPLLFYRAIDENIIKKYKSSQKYGRYFYRKVLFRAQKKYRLALKLILESYLKTIVYTLLSIIGKTDLIVNRRYIRLSEDIKHKVQNMLALAIRKCS